MLDWMDLDTRQRSVDWIWITPRWSGYLLRFGPGYRSSCRYIETVEFSYPSENSASQSHMLLVKVQSGSTLGDGLSRLVVVARSLLLQTKQFDKHYESERDSIHILPFRSDLSLLSVVFQRDPPVYKSTRSSQDCHCLFFTNKLKKRKKKVPAKLRFWFF